MTNKSIFSVRRFGLYDMISSQEFEFFHSYRVFGAFGYGTDRSTHCEILSDWTNYLTTLRLPKGVINQIRDRISKCKSYLEHSGALHLQRL